MWWQLGALETYVSVLDVFSVQETVLALCPGVQRTDQSISFREIFVKGSGGDPTHPP